MSCKVVPSNKMVPHTYTHTHTHNVTLHSTSPVQFLIYCCIHRLFGKKTYLTFRKQQYFSSPFSLINKYCRSIFYGIEKYIRQNKDKFILTRTQKSCWLCDSHEIRRLTDFLTDRGSYGIHTFAMYDVLDCMCLWHHYELHTIILYSLL